ncbi:hypothetical protein GCM10025771_20530 [Niveibacterium umoris]|uniref:Uncharacterized protein n=1 Tax=Niveibacterium umoris TaxID=1193620 RepID=A0A840BQR8_9RHOO|nr:hypothetical protein [Niveibacterium umoris]MBB4012757.1 hypothetical protein [Niveibacterium umoris]
MNTPALRRFVLALLAALAMIGIGFAALSAALKGKESAEADFRTAERERNAIASRLSAAQRDEPEIRRALAQFDALRKQGLVGAERRLEWAEAVTQTRARRKLPSLEFELAPQRTLPGAHPELPLLSSAMTLRARVWHEGDLLRILGDLHGQRSATVLPRHCVIERDSGDTGDEAAPLGVVCELDWITLGTPGPVRP